MGSHLASFVLGAVVLGLLFWVFKAGDPRSMQVMGVALTNPETQLEKVPVDGIGIHKIIGNGAHSHGAMSAEQTKEETESHAKAEREIFFQPAGLYTMADIERNGPLSPARKFYDVMTRHDLKVHKGEPICPITETRANGSLSWWVGGKRYTFCCPPCIEEFVMKAKRGDAEAKKSPEEYVKR